MNELIIQDKSFLDARTKEKYRTLRTNIEFCGIENKVIVFTSCAPGDGKSTVSYQLARAMAEAEKKVLLIDADLRRSTLLERLSVKGNPIGLSHILTGRNELRESIYVTNIPRFHMMPTGVFPTNPAELLGKKSFSNMIKALSDKFHYILIDAPPIGRVIDAAVVASHCDGVVMVVYAQKNSRREERLAVEQMRTANPNILGVVLNRVEQSKRIFSNKNHDAYYYYEPSKKEKRKKKKEMRG